MKGKRQGVAHHTLFTEENRYEQRPYRFRTPYTVAQGAKNRLAEALAWELTEKGIQSIATNPGPVHSDRIYKTVYPKAAAYMDKYRIIGTKNKLVDNHAHGLHDGCQDRGLGV